MSNMSVFCWNGVLHESERVGVLLDQVLLHVHCRLGWPATAAKPDDLEALLARGCSVALLGLEQHDQGQVANLKSSPHTPSGWLHYSLHLRYAASHAISELLISIESFGCRHSHGVLVRIARCLQCSATRHCRSDGPGWPAGTPCRLVYSSSSARCSFAGSGSRCLQRW